MLAQAHVVPTPGLPEAPPRAFPAHFPRDWVVCSETSPMYIGAKPVLSVIWFEQSGHLRAGAALQTAGEKFWDECVGGNGSCHSCRGHTSQMFWNLLARKYSFLHPEFWLWNWGSSDVCSDVSHIRYLYNRPLIWSFYPSQKRRKLGRKFQLKKIYSLPNLWVKCEVSILASDVGGWHHWSAHSISRFAWLAQMWSEEDEGHSDESGLGKFRWNAHLCLVESSFGLWVYL